MLANRDRYLAVFVLTLAFTPAVGQTATGACAWDPFAVTPPGCKTASSLRQPPAQPFYTAEFKTTRVQTLANGTTITRESTETRALDSQGRSMVATTEALPNGTQQPIHIRAGRRPGRGYTGDLELPHQGGQGGQAASAGSTAGLLAIGFGRDASSITGLRRTRLGCGAMPRTHRKPLPTSLL